MKFSEYLNESTEYNTYNEYHRQIKLLMKKCTYKLTQKQMFGITDYLENEILSDRSKYVDSYDGARVTDIRNDKKRIKETILNRIDDMYYNREPFKDKFDAHESVILGHIDRLKKELGLSEKDLKDVYETILYSDQMRDYGDFSNYNDPEAWKYFFSSCHGYAEEHYGK